MPENSKNEVEFRRNMYFSHLNLTREARREKLYIEPKANKTHWIGGPRTSGSPAAGCAGAAAVL